jgi:hypothetical protein
MTPSVSAYAYLQGKHNYNANPFAPLGCKVEAHVTPENQETWAPHTESGFYVGNAWEHYLCHKIYICDTKHTRTCLTTFFKHKYPTMPMITPANALIHTADYLTDAVSGLIPASTCRQDAVDQLMVIFKQQARVAYGPATAQRVLRERPQTERMKEEEHQILVQAQVTPSPCFEIKENDNIAHTPQGIPQITQDKNDASPSANTQQQRQIRTLTQEFMLQCMKIPGYKAPFTMKQAALRIHPLQFLCDLAYAVLNNKTGNLLEYRHLMKHPKYKDVWTKLLGTDTPPHHNHQNHLL